MAWFKVTVTTSSTEVFTSTTKAVSIIILKNTGAYPITLDTATPVVADTGIVLETDESVSLDCKTNNLAIMKIYAIAVGGSSQLSIFTA